MVIKYILVFYWNLKVFCVIYVFYKSCGFKNESWMEEMDVVFYKVGCGWSRYMVNVFYFGMLFV